MPKGSSSYPTGGSVLSFSCPCKKEMRTFTTKKQKDMFAKLHKKYCEYMKQDINNYPHFVCLSQNGSVDLKHELYERRNEIKTNCHWQIVIFEE